MQRKYVTHENVVFWISRFMNGSIESEKHRKDIIDLSLNSAYVYDDRIVLFFNFRDGCETITLQDIQGSDLDALGPPRPRINKIRFVYPRPLFLTIISR
jgi:hypothetical protein